MKTLEELNLVDDFLVNSLTSHKIYGEQSARYILECILRRQIGKLTVVPQRFFCGENTETHGIRLDVYLDEENGEIFDIEPDQNDGKEEIVSLPRRVRFYHAKIDAGNLTAGDTYGSLRNVIVEELKQLLHYMEHSSIENAPSENLKKLHRMVTAVKRDGEVGLAYMKSFEREERIRKQGEAEGRKAGLEEGKKAGLEEGLQEGKEVEIIKLGSKFGKSDAEILALLQEELQITEEQAKQVLEKYGKTLDL